MTMNDGSPLEDSLNRLLAFRGQHADGAMVDPLSKLMTGDLDAAIEAMRGRLLDRRKARPDE